MQRCLTMDQKIYVWFIDFGKAFDKVKHDLKEKILIVVTQEYNQSELESGDQSPSLSWTISEEISILRNGCQGCILPPVLFNVYSEKFFKELQTGSSEGVSINDEVICNRVHYPAKDIIISTENLLDLQNLLEWININFNNYGLKINLKKKCMIVTKNLNVNENVVSGAQIRVERVAKSEPLDMAHSKCWTN